MASNLKTEERGSAIARMPVLLAIVAVATAIGLVIAAEFAPRSAQGVVAIDASTQPPAAPASTPTQVAPSGADSQPLDPELLRTDRANEHHG